MMGCIYNKVRSVSTLPSKVGTYNGSSKPPPWLTSCEIAVIRNNWQTLKVHIANVGIITFVGMFESNPDMQRLFVDFRDVDVSQIQKNSMLRQHALRVMGTIDKCITRMDEPERLIELLKGLGSTHIQYKVPPESIQIILPHFLNAIRPHIQHYWSDDMAQAWTHLFSIIVYYLQQGMQQSKSDLKSSSSVFTVPGP